MTKKELQTLKQILLDKQREISGHMNTIRENERENTVKESSGDHSAYAFHMADQGTDAMEREKNFFYAQRDGKLLTHIEMALERMDEGNYGQCRSCGNDIGFARLEAVPHATLCINCKSNREKLRIEPEEEVEEEV